MAAIDASIAMIAGHRSQIDESDQRFAVPSINGRSIGAMHRSRLRRSIKRQADQRLVFEASLITSALGLSDVGSGSRHTSSPFGAVAAASKPDGTSSAMRRLAVLSAM